MHDLYGGYVKWKVNGSAVMSDDDPTGKTWTDDLSDNLKKLLWEDLGLENKVKVSSFPKSLTFTKQPYPIPGIKFNEFALDVTKLLTNLKIYVSEKDSFTATMKNVFKIKLWDLPVEKKLELG